MEETIEEELAICVLSLDTEGINRTVVVGGARDIGNNLIFLSNASYGNYYSPFYFLDDEEEKESQERITKISNEIIVVIDLLIKLNKEFNQTKLPLEIAAHNFNSSCMRLYQGNAGQGAFELEAIGKKVGDYINNLE